MLEIKSLADGISFRVKVAPRASRSTIAGIHAGALKVSLTAPPVEGEANLALCELLARTLGVAKREVEITHGQQSKQKTVKIRGVSEAQARSLLG